MKNPVSWREDGCNVLHLSVFQSRQQNQSIKQFQMALDQNKEEKI